MPPPTRSTRTYPLFPFTTLFRSVLSLGAFCDTGAKGALRVVESVWGDPDNDRLLLAEEDESYANEFKVYDLQGRFTGRTFGGDFLQAQAEGIALKACA